MLDLNDYKPALIDFIQSEVARFSRENPEVVVACAALYSNPISGWVFLNFDSAENSQHFLEEWYDEEDEQWVGVDDEGPFNDSCPDYDFFEYGRIDFDEWTDEIEDDPVIVLQAQGKKTTVDLEEDGDERLNRVFFLWFKDILEELDGEGVFHQLERDKNFRLGVQLLDSEWEAFWVMS